MMLPDLPGNPQRDRRQRRLLIGLALLFFAPLAVAFYLYYGHLAWRPGSRVNHGDLIDPARPLPDRPLPRDVADGTGRPATISLKGKWTLLYVGAGECSAVCRVDLYNTRQVRIALNREMDRVQRVFIAQGACCDWPFLTAQHPDLAIVRATAAPAALLSLLPPDPQRGLADGVPGDRIFFIDPLGNLMMSYAPDAKAKGMLQDLKRLLSLSHVG